MTVVSALVVMSVGTIAPAAALAATVLVEPGSASSRGKVLFEAAVGERNDVTVAREYDRDPVTGMFRYGFVVTVSDTAAVITPGASCESVDTHTARCRTEPGSDLDPVELQLGDSDDRLRTLPSPDPTRAVGIGVVAVGGPGNDVLDLRQGIARGVLDGGGGKDELYGGSSPDFLTDGDRDGAAGDAGPGPDVLDGGGDRLEPLGDVIGYQFRTRPVTVDLRGNRPAGEPGEGDVIRGIEAAAGGSASDWLAGTNGPNYFAGGGGDDTLIGRGGTDRFGSVGLEPPADRALLAIREGTRGDTVSCGRGPDDVYLPSKRTYVRADCELLRLFTRGRYTQDTQLPYPTRRGRSLSYPVRCSFEEDFDDPRWAAVRCSGTLSLREALRPRRVLATGVIRRGRFVIPTRLRLTATGRMLAARSRPLSAVMRITGRHLPTASWTIRLALPR